MSRSVCLLALLVCGLGPALAVQGAAASEAAAVQVTVGMPFTGRWAASEPRKPPYNNRTDSHPSVHELYGGDWSTDLYARKGTPVRLLVSSPSGVVSLALRSRGDSCAKQGAKLGGLRVSYWVSVGKTRVGYVSLSHLDKLAVPSSENGWRVGEVTSEGPAKGCYDVSTEAGRHVHIELKNASDSTHACWLDKGQAGKIVNEGSPLGLLGASKSRMRQACSKAKPSTARVGDILLVSSSTSGTPGNDHSGNIVYSKLDWRSDGYQLAFQSRATNLGPKRKLANPGVYLFVKDLRTSEVRLLGTPNWDDFDWSPDGTKLAYSVYLPGAISESLLIKDLQTGRVTPLNTRRICAGQRSCGLYSHLAFSPQGDRIAFTHNRRGNYKIHVANLRTGLLTLVSATGKGTPTKGAADFAVWSRDGTKIAFTSGGGLGGYTGSAKRNVYAKDLRTGRLTLVSDVAGLFGKVSFGTPSWDPTGTQIVFEVRDPYPAPEIDDLYIKDLRTGGTATLSAPGLEALARPAWSPDGSRIAFTALTRENQLQVYLKDLRSGRVVLVSSTKAGAPADNTTSWGSTWSPDSTKIAFASDASNLDRRVGKLGQKAFLPDQVYVKVVGS